MNALIAVRISYDGGPLRRHTIRSVRHYDGYSILCCVDDFPRN